MTSKLVFDSGPLIALFYAADTHHNDAVRGMEQLKREKVRFVAPLPVLLEVHKFLLYKSHRALADRGLKAMLRMTYIDGLEVGEVIELAELANAPQGWNGSLEDASVILTARKFGCPAWTYNYRDFAAFRDLELWNPS